MGEAKRRGTFEQRKAEAIERNKVTAEYREKERQQRLKERQDAQVDKALEKRWNKKMSRKALICAATIGIASTMTKGGKD